MRDHVVRHVDLAGLDVQVRLQGELAEPRQARHRLEVVGRIRHAIVVDLHPSRGVPIANRYGALQLADAAPLEGLEEVGQGLLLPGLGPPGYVVP